MYTKYTPFALYVSPVLDQAMQIFNGAAAPMTAIFVRIRLKSAVIGRKHLICAVPPHNCLNFFKRYKPLVIIAEENILKSRMPKHVLQHIRRSTGRAISASLLSRRAQANELLVSAQAALERGDYAALRSHLEALGAYADALKDDGAALYETLRSYID